MLYTVMAVVRPALTLEMERAALIPTEPAAIAVYALLACSFVLVWRANQGSGVEDTQAGGTPDPQGNEDASASNDGSASSDEEAGEAHASSTVRGGRDRNRGSRRGRKKLTRTQRRRRGHINWIQ